MRRRMLLLLALVLGSCAPAGEVPDGFEEVFAACRQRAMSGCGGVWECEDSLRTRCMAERGWKQVGGQWKLGKDAQRAREIDRLEDAAGKAEPEPQPPVSAPNP